MSEISENVRCWCGGLAAQTGRTTEQPWVCLESEFHNPRATGRPVEINRLYVAGPMSNYSENNYPEFNRVADLLEKAGYEVCNPASFGLTGTGAHYTDLIREDLRALLDCHGVAVLENWWESPGARNEVMVAGLLKMPVRSFSEWLYFREK